MVVGDASLNLERRVEISCGGLCVMEAVRYERRVRSHGNNIEPQLGDRLKSLDDMVRHFSHIGH